ncbi:MAG: patatin-like phospholipase family protein, partial [Synergistaceae bacterium]|nr:patatin-like phospholipase family protein [Synergistaceae bacterium]
MREVLFFRGMFRGFSLIVLFSLLCASTASDAAGVPDSQRRGGVVLVLSGGGTRGFAHIGVLKVFEREKIPIVGIVGTSIGSIIGGLYASGYGSDEIRTIIDETDIMGLLADAGTRLKIDSANHTPSGETLSPMRVDFDKKFKVIGPRGLLPALSLVNFLTKYTGHIHTTDFNSLPVPFACVATDLSTGEAVVMREGNLASALRASASIPGILEPWPLGGRLLVDGGLVANLPVEIAREIFPGYPVIAVNLSGQTTSKPNESFTGVIDVMMQTIDIMTLENIRRNEAKADLVLYPDVGIFSMLDARGYGTIYDRGLDVAEARLSDILAVSAKAPAVFAKQDKEPDERVVGNVKVEGLSEREARDIVKTYSVWIGKSYDINEIDRAIESLTKRAEIATVDVSAHPADSLNPNVVDVVFSVDRRPSFELALDGYTSNLHQHRWLEVMMNARDLASMGDAANLMLRYGENEWNVNARYFTPVLNGGQWGFALGAKRDKMDPKGFDGYAVERYQARAVYYKENENSRLGFGLAAEHANAKGDFDDYEFGPYLYFNADTLDNLLMPSKGYSFNTQIWWNSDYIWVSRTNLT